jgi:hypothetical protein
MKKKRKSPVANTTKPPVPTKPTWIDELHCVASNLTSEAQCLEDLGHAFYRVGNTTLGQQMMLMAERMDNFSESVGRCTGQAVDEQFKQTEQASKNMLAGVFAGAALEADDPDRKKTLKELSESV